MPELFRAAVDEGWVVDETGAHLLKLFRRRYHGNRDLFTDLTGYEAAVNGRGVPDMDVTERGAARVQVLVRRAYAFAWMALFSLRTIPGRATVDGYISVGPALMNEDWYTANVTFCVDRGAEAAYVSDIENAGQSAILVLSSTECDTPLPG